MNRRKLLLIFTLGFLSVILAGCGSSDTTNLKGKKMTVYYSPSCSCCGRYIDYLQSKGMKVKTIRTRTPQLIKAEHGISNDVASCHTGIIGDYFVEGHVPAQSISKLIREQLSLAGITIPGMPRHAPGMGRPNGSTLRVESVGPDGTVTDVFREITY